MEGNKKLAQLLRLDRLDKVGSWTNQSFQRTKLKEGQAKSTSSGCCLCSEQTFGHLAGCQGLLLGLSSAVGPLEALSY